MFKQRVAIVQEVIPHYRLPFFNSLSNHRLITLFSGESCEDNSFDSDRVEITRVVGFVHHNISFAKLASYDRIVVSFNVRWTLLYRVLFSAKLRKKVVLWGIGVSTSSTYDSRRYLDLLRIVLIARARNVIFYSNMAKLKYARYRLVQDKLYVANNSIQILSSEIEKGSRDCFVFVGSLTPYKKILSVIDLYAKYLERSTKKLPLKLIGDGELRTSVEKKLIDLDIVDKVELLGSITDENNLINIYKGAVACISPYQAGLTVIQSLAFSTPVVALQGAITGGELFNIENNRNGYLVPTEDEIVQKMILLEDNISLTKKLSDLSYMTYKNNVTLQGMVNGFIEGLC